MMITNNLYGPKMEYDDEDENDDNDDEIYKDRSTARINSSRMALIVY